MANTKQRRGGGGAARGSSVGAGHVATRHGDGSTCSARPAMGGGSVLRLAHGLDVRAVYACGAVEICVALTRGGSCLVVLGATSRDGLKVIPPRRMLVA